MNYLGKYYLFIILFGIFQIAVLSQNKSTYKITAAPTANNFEYPQSIFVDSPNGHIWITDFSNHRVLRFDVSSLTSVSESEKLQSPQYFLLSQNYPNPFNGETQITFSTNSTEVVLLTVYDLLGQNIATLFDEVAVANTVYSIRFDAKNLPSGIYLYSLRTVNGNEVKRMCLLK
jgi:hypothetical protein